MAQFNRYRGDSKRQRRGLCKGLVKARRMLVCDNRQGDFGSPGMRGEKDRRDDIGQGSIDEM